MDGCSGGGKNIAREEQRGRAECGIRKRAPSARPSLSGKDRAKQKRERSGSVSAGGGREGGPGPRPRASDQRRLLAFGTQDTHSINNTHRLLGQVSSQLLEAGSAQTRRAANAPMPMLLSRDHFTSRGLLLSSLPIDLALPLSIPSHNDPTSAMGGLDNLPSIPFTSSIPESQFPPLLHLHRGKREIVLSPLSPLTTGQRASRGPIQ